MKRRTGIFLLLLPFLMFSCSCKKNNSLGPNPVPYQSVYTVIDITLPQYSDLQNEGGSVTIPGGNKGIIVVHDFLDNFWAFDRTCPYHINSPCGVVRMSFPDALYMVCGTYSGKTLNACCNSTYNLNGGTVINGPSKYPLKAYQVTQSGTVLSISN